MPLVNIALQQQEQASAAGIYSYPSMPNFAKFAKWRDYVGRLAVNLSGAAVLYTTTVTGTGAVAVQNSINIRLTTGTTISSEATLTGDGVIMDRNPSPFLGSFTTIKVIMVFGTGGNVADLENFIGLTIPDDGVLTALPTTARHMGVFVDTAADGNMFLTSANGTDQVTTDSGTALTASTVNILQITWTGNNSAIIELFDVNNVLLASQTVTAFGVSRSMFQTFLGNLAGADKVLEIREWGFDMS